MLLLLLLAGVPMKERELYGRTPLHIAVEAQAYACAAFLLQIGESPLVEDKFGRTPLKSARKDPRMWQLFESVREAKMSTNEQEQALRKLYARSMFSEFFSDLWYNTFAVLASYLPFFSYSSRRSTTTTTTSATRERGSSRGLEEGGSIHDGVGSRNGASSSSTSSTTTPHGEERHFEELYFKLLREEQDGGVTSNNGDYLNVRFKLVHASQALTVFGVKSLLFQKYGLTPEKVRLCAMLDLPPPRGGGGNTTPTEGDIDEGPYDAEVRELADTMTLRDCGSQLAATSTLYLDYIPILL